MTDLSPAALLAAGFLSQPDAVAEVRREVGDPHSGPDGGAWRITMAGGFSVEVLPERGLDLGSAWVAGQPLAWRSALGPRGAASDPGHLGWIGRFTGGLLATCGLDNIGPARGGLEQHGSHHATPAADVALTRLPDGAVRVSGTVDSSLVFGRAVRVTREIEVAAGRPMLEVRDRVVNDGTTEQPIPLLYHVNFGAPFVLPGTTVSIEAAHHEPRDDAATGRDWRVFPEPTDEVMESVWQHGGLVADGGRARAAVTSPVLGLTAELSWPVAGLDRCLQWVYPTRRGWALGIEPANAPIFGPARDDPHAGAPVLAPGEEREFTVRLAVSMVGDAARSS